MSIFKRTQTPEPTPEPTPHIVDVEMSRAQDWSFTRETKEECDAILELIGKAINDGTEAIMIGTVLLRVSQIVSAKYRDHHISYGWMF